jgi:hypothetical protein
LLFYDDPFVFVIILRAKAPSLVTNDEPTKFVIECSHSVTKFLIVTAESSLMNTFLVVDVKVVFPIEVANDLTLDVTPVGATPRRAALGLTATAVPGRDHRGKAGALERTHAHTQEVDGLDEIWPAQVPQLFGSFFIALHRLIQRA